LVYRALEEREHVLLALDPRHLTVEGRELRHVADRVRRLRPERGRDLEDAVEARRHEHLFVQLRALAQVRPSPEIVGLEQGGAAFRPGSRELRRVDLHEGLALQVAANGGFDEGPDVKDRPAFRFAEVQGPVVESCIHVRADLVSYGEREGSRGGAEHVDRRREELPAVPDLSVRLDGPAGRHAALPDDLRRAIAQVGVRLLDRDLERSRALSDDEERDPPEVPYVLRPPGEGDLLPMIRRSDRGEGAERSRHGAAEKDELP